jgi:DNA-binding MarR family transcriptional regulator
VIAYDRATIGSVLDRLEAKGLVRREMSKTDRRVRQLNLEPAGHKLLKTIDPLVARVQDHILDPLTREERETFLKILLKLADANNERSRAPLRPLG